MAQEFKYSDGSIGSGRWFDNDGDNISPQVLVRKINESEFKWIERLWNLYETRPVKHETPAHNPRTQDIGDKVETIDGDGYLVVSYPNPINKTPCWNKSNKEVMYVSEGQAVPDTYTFDEPLDGQSVEWSDIDGWFVNIENLGDSVRETRNQLLLKCDWTQTGDTPLTESEKIAWAEYRQLLRDVPEQDEFPSEINWPEKPE